MCVILVLAAFCADFRRHKPIRANNSLRVKAVRCVSVFTRRVSIEKFLFVAWREWLKAHVPFPFGSLRLLAHGAALSAFHHGDDFEPLQSFYFTPRALRVVVQSSRELVGAENKEGWLYDGR